MKLIEGVDCFSCNSTGQLLTMFTGDKAIEFPNMGNWKYCDCQYGQKLREIRDMIGYHRRSNKG